MSKLPPPEYPDPFPNEDMLKLKPAVPLPKLNLVPLLPPEPPVSVPVVSSGLVPGSFPSPAPGLVPGSVPSPVSPSPIISAAPLSMVYKS